MTDRSRSRGIGGRGALLFGRGLNTLFFLATSAYCILTYSSFAYQQFIRPHLVSSLTDFVVWHHLWHWAALAVTAALIVPELRHVAPKARALGWSYLAAMVVLGGVLAVRPVLPEVENDGLGLWLALAFLVPPLWLSVYDHCAAETRAPLRTTDERQILRASLAAAVFVWFCGLAAIPLRLNDLGDLMLTGRGLAFGAATSLVLHLALLTAPVLLLLPVLRLVRRAAWRADAEYLAIAALAWAGTLLAVVRLVFAPLSFRGTPAWCLGMWVALMLTLGWSAMAVRTAHRRSTPTATALEVWLAPATGVWSWRGWAALLVLPLAAFVSIERAATFDWDFLLQNLIVALGWFLAVAWIHGASPIGAGRRLTRLALPEQPDARPGPAGVRPATLAITCGVLLTAGVARGAIEGTVSTRLTGDSFVPEFALDAYAAVDPSFRLIRRLLWVEPPGSGEFFSTLAEHSLIERVAVDPIDVDFVSPLEAAPLPPPHIFLFVVDSLRRDYVAPFNQAAADFTPAIARFAAESDVFVRAFTRYGGTGLSMPAIWAGGMILHKEYVQPFAPMNALGKLLDANHYRRLLSLDHITAQLFVDDEDFEELDRGHKEMQYDLCTTLGELQTRVRARDRRAPIFAHTRSLNLHVSKLTRQSRVAGPRRDGFQGPAADAIGRMDQCFGTFIEFLKREKLYDDSIVILTSDHGDSLGELKRWGHSYTLFPEVLRTPLIVHVPLRLRRDLAVDHDAVTLSTDITPTLYALLGYAPRDLGWVYGTSLFVPPDGRQTPRQERSHLVASSYGPVYGLLEDNGRSLYVADGVNRRDYAYDLSALRPARVGISAARRERSRALIESRVRELSGLYRFEPVH